MEPTADRASTPADDGDKTFTMETDDVPPVTESQNLSNTSLATTSSSPDPGDSGEEQALDSNEVLELQGFIEKKDWIVDKIKLLEQMPPIEVFVGLESVKTSAEEVVGLPTRDKLKQWLVEHDAIEKETEIFDTGELKKLRKFTRAATKRNLSPQDTDLIELTLTTIYELDKLLHLLRDRSDNLDLLGTRMTWEENRIAAWKERRSIIEDLQRFLDTRGRWSPSVYETVANEPLEESKETVPKTIHRRSSVTSMISMASASSAALASSDAFSRSARFRVAEGLSREAAQFAARVATLRHGKINTAGKVLDKLIDNSKKPVPDELLDEQDKLEEKLSEMDDISKFVLNITTQWRKADEMYIETVKDQNAAQTLLNDIEDSKAALPDGHLSITFCSRAETLLKRLALRGNPTSSYSSFPRPFHMLFPGQHEANETINQTLSDEIASARHLIAQADREAKEYRSLYQAVKRVQDIQESIQESSRGLTAVLTRLEHGIEGGEGDGSPPDLMHEDCLQPTKHAVFLALLPSILEEEEKYRTTADEAVRGARPALLALKALDIDPNFHDNAAKQVQTLSSLIAKLCNVRDVVVGRTKRLRESRKIWSTMEECLHDLSEHRRVLGETMEQKRWRQQCAIEGAPPTPDSPMPARLPEASSQNGAKPSIQDPLHQLKERIVHDVRGPFEPLSRSLESPVRDRLSHGVESLDAALRQVQQMNILLQAIDKQSTTMGDVRGEFQTLQVRIEDAHVRLDTIIEQTIAGTIAHVEAVSIEDKVNNDIRSLQADVKTFVDTLSTRVPFLSRQAKPSSDKVTFVAKRFGSVDLTLNHPLPSNSIELPFELQQLDDAVRNDCNTYALRINGASQSLERKSVELHLSVLAADADSKVAATSALLVRGAEELTSWQSSFNSLASGTDQLESLPPFLTSLDSRFNALRDEIYSSFEPLRSILSSMEEYQRSHDTSSPHPLILARAKRLKDMELDFSRWTDKVSALRLSVVDAHQAEVTLAEKRRLEEEKRLKEEEARQAAEAAERERQEQARLLEEARKREEEERLAEELRAKEEQARLAAEAAEKARLEQERLQAEEDAQMERKRQEEEERRRQEEERLAAREMERKQLEEERRTIADRLRVTEEQLANERKQHQEKDKKTAQETEHILQENQRLRNEELRLRREAEERRIQTEKERAHYRKLKSKEVATPLPSPSIQTPEEDVFGLRVAPSGQDQVVSPVLLELQNKIIDLRKRLRSLSINELARSSSSSSLPSEEQVATLAETFGVLEADTIKLPQVVDSATVTAEIRSLRLEVQESAKLIDHLHALSRFATSVIMADAALSDLLEHVDSYPIAPTDNLASSHRSSPKASPEDKLSARLSFTSNAADEVSLNLVAVSQDPRALREEDRVKQTWSELQEMAQDRLQGISSRPASVISSGRNSRASSGRNSRASLRGKPSKASGYSALSASTARATPSRLKPPTPSRRAISGSPGRPSTSMSTASPRSFSGPGNSTLLQGTVASRQRTTSLTKTTTPRRPSSGMSSRPRASLSVTKRSASPSVSTSSHSHTSSLGTWSRAPRLSTPAKPPPRKKYVANPKSKLDVAVADVVNKLPMNIDIQADSWKDQSGKYWIGDPNTLEPKLCFCRILRSQTIMVRVGGGWQELSKFIRDHFADSFRIMEGSFNASPPRMGSKEEKWISSSTLLDHSTILESPPEPPKTPEPVSRRLPSFSISSPSGASPRSLRSTPSSHGSPGSSNLTPLQFLRRVDEDISSVSTPLPSLLRPVTPTRVPRNRQNIPNTPQRTSIWRP